MKLLKLFLWSLTVHRIISKQAIKNGQSRETGNIVYTRQRKTELKHNTTCVGHHYTQVNTNNVNKT